ncbi:hypothetical protein DFP72DRAFT_307035 [Ephemerocybe angulata]|uniref:SET domain-containing protein n=1 Tax=Ephemerocybe angulata TaxID=980116 RepID=A0A8H6I131_9AGAR|nr:hypothetical protein DFP72DRAFT_307035 [Tulosesus angulatus]
MDDMALIRHDRSGPYYSNLGAIIHRDFFRYSSTTFSLQLSRALPTSYNLQLAWAVRYEMTITTIEKIPSPYVHHVIELPSPSEGEPSTKISCLLHPTLIPLLPSPSATPMIEDPPYEVHNTLTKGFGMFAKRPISKGSLIITEHPAYILPGFASNKVSLEDFEEVWRRLPREVGKEVASMANCRTLEESPSIIDGVARTNALTIQLEFPSNFPDKSPGAKHYGGLFLKIGRCNHSCGINAGWEWDFSTLSSTLFALRDIEAGEEITNTYVHPLQSKADRWKKLQPDYRFDCDCPWCNHKDEAEQAASDRDREYIGTYVPTRPTYVKWAIDLCLPDDFVINSHLAVLPIIRKEGLHRLLPLFMEDIVRCYAELGDEENFRLWAEETVQLCRTGQKELAEEFSLMLQNPQRNCAKWGQRKRLQEERMQQDLNYDFEADDTLINLFGTSPP